MKQRIGEKIKLTSYSELLGISDEQSSIDLESIRLNHLKIIHLRSRWIERWKI